MSYENKRITIFNCSYQRLKKLNVFNQRKKRVRKRASEKYTPLKLN